MDCEYEKSEGSKSDFVLRKHSGLALLCSSSLPSQLMYSVAILRLALEVCDRRNHLGPVGAREAIFSNRLFSQFLLSIRPFARVERARKQESTLLGRYSEQKEHQELEGIKKGYQAKFNADGKK